VSLEDHVDPDERSTRDDVVAVVRAVASRGWAIAGTGAGVVSSGVDDALRVLVHRRVVRALRSDRAMPSRVELVEALDCPAGSVLSPWIGAGAARLARTGRATRVLGGRTPLGLAVRFGPAAYAAISGNVRGLDAAVAHLVARARRRRIEPDPERLHRVVVQALTGQPVAPDADVDHGPLLRAWLGDAGRRAVPFGLDRISGFRNGLTPEAAAAVLESVDVRRLAAR